MFVNPNGAPCLEALKGIRNPYWIGDQPAGTEVSGWLDAWSPAPSAYAIRARHAADVAAGITFARANNLRLVVKGSAHSYQGTSNAPDSLLIWTRSMNRVVLHNGEACPRQYAEMARDCWGQNAEWLGQVRHCLFLIRGKMAQNPASGGVGKGCKNGSSPSLIVNQLVNYIISDCIRQDSGETMNIALWVLQVLAALLYASSRVMKVFMFDEVSQEVPSLARCRGKPG